jgi:predicted NBD/HSP70 family sugar kinase
VARGLLLYGGRIADGSFNRDRFLKAIGVDNGTLRSAAAELGAKQRPSQLRFFDSSETGKITFGPSAGLALGVSLGSQSLRATLVDANGVSRVTWEGAGIPAQLEQPPDFLLDRIKEGAGAVIGRALELEELKVNGALPLLGVSVAWPTPLTRGKLPVGNALAHHSWRHGTPVTDRVAHHLGIELERSHAMNDAAAAAIAVAYDQTTRREHLKQQHPRLTVTLRLAGGVGAGMVVVEPRQDDPDLGSTSGFSKSVLIGGVDHHSGEIGHVPANRALIEQLNGETVDNLGPLVAAPCSCAPAEEPELAHLESFTGGLALARRIDPSRPAGEVVEDVVTDPDVEAHRKALEDIGTLMADALVSPLAMLNPAAVVLTGALALAPVEKAMREKLTGVPRFGSQPTVSRLTDADANRFARARGAALVVLRRHVFRELRNLLGGDEAQVLGKVRDLTQPLPANPWESTWESQPIPIPRSAG